MHLTKCLTRLLSGDNEIIEKGMGHAQFLFNPPGQFLNISAGRSVDYLNQIGLAMDKLNGNVTAQILLATELGLNRPESWLDEIYHK